MSSEGLADLLPKAAARFGDRIALTFPGQREWTFCALNDRAARLASGLMELGIKPGDRVLLHLPNCAEWVIAYHAIARLGAIVVPVNIMATPRELIHIASDADVCLALIVAEKADELNAAGFKIVACSPSAEDDAFHALWSGEPLEAVAAVKPDDIWSICYTSGTTGRPKGAMQTHGNVFQSIAGTVACHQRVEQDIVYSALPFAHVYGNVVLNAVFYAGARLVAPPRFDAAQALDLIETHRVTLFEGVPTMYYQMLALPNLDGRRLASLNRCTVGGQTMPVAKLDAVCASFGVPMLELWGMTELSGPATSHSPLWPPRHGSAGRPFPETCLKIVSVDDRTRELPLGCTGEILIRGPLVMQGYWRDPQGTREVLSTDGWMATGDVGYLDADGYLFIADRKKDVILTAGFNVYPAELEQVLSMHPSVRIAVVVGIPDEDKGEVAHAYLVIDPAAPTDEADIVAHCRMHLSAYKVPRRIHFVDDLPKTSSGKLMRNVLRENYLALIKTGEHHG